jgi:hypothetical protein
VRLGDRGGERDTLNLLRLPSDTEPAMVLSGEPLLTGEVASALLLFDLVRAERCEFSRPVRRFFPCAISV